MSVAPEDVNEMLLREWHQSQQNYLRSESHRLSIRAVDKVAAEFRQRGFNGFICYMQDGKLQIEGVSR